MIHVIEFFELSNSPTLAITLAIAFEVGAAASLASIIVLEKMNKTIVWGLFIILTLIQMMGNTFFAFVHLENFQGWVDLFALNQIDPLAQKRILAIISGAVLPIVALGFIKALVDYIRPSDEIKKIITTDNGISVTENEFLSDNISDITPEVSSVDISNKTDTEDIKTEETIPEKKTEVINQENLSPGEIIIDDNFNRLQESGQIAQPAKINTVLEKIDTKDPAFVKMVEEYINKTKRK